MSLLLPGVVLLSIGALCTGYYCYRVTGRLTFPWMAHWKQAGMAPPFLFGKPNYTVHYQFPEQLVYNRDSDMLPYNNLKETGQIVPEIIAKGIYEWLFFIFPALTLPLIGIIPTLRATKSRWLLYALGFACIGYLSETWLQAHYFAVASGIIYLVLLNGLRWMLASSRNDLLWLKLMRGTLASIIIMFFIRLIVVPMNSFPGWGTWMNLTGPTPAWQDVHSIMESKPGEQLVIVRYRPDHLWVNDWIYNGYDIPSQHVIWARDSEPGESNTPLLCEFKNRQVWLLVPPEHGFIQYPDRTASWKPDAAEQFLQPYPVPQPLVCNRQP